ncbi:hypothetical protein GCM10026915_37040 [Simiduia litorea]
MRSTAFNWLNIRLKGRMRNAIIDIISWQFTLIYQMCNRRLVSSFS